MQIQQGQITQASEDIRETRKIDKFIHNFTN